MTAAAAGTVTGEAASVGSIERLIGKIKRRTPVVSIQVAAAPIGSG